jgi:hypothetical protein
VFERPVLASSVLGLVLSDNGAIAPTPIRQSQNNIWRCSMLWTVFLVLMILWLLGMVTSYTLGGFIHILLIVAIAAVLIRIIQGRNPI